MGQSQEIAKILLKIKAVTLNLKHPYRYTSGILSPIYCDNRLLISYPSERKIILEAFLNTIKENKLEFDIVAGTATAGIPHAAWIADRLNLPMVYVRGKAKEHGLQNQIEGKTTPGQRALVIEDLISTGGSAIGACFALQEADVEVEHCLAIFNYQMEVATTQFYEAGINLHPLCNFATLIEVAEKEKYISTEEKNIAASWNKDPSKWKAPALHDEATYTRSG